MNAFLEFFYPQRFLVQRLKPFLVKFSIILFPKEVG